MFAHAATTQTLSVAVGSLYNIGLLFDKRFRGFRGVQLPATCFEFPEIRFVVRVLLHAMARNQDRLATVSNMFKTIVKGDPRSAGDIECALDETGANWVVICVGTGESVSRSDIRTSNAIAVASTLQKPIFSHARYGAFKHWGRPKQNAHWTRSWNVLYIPLASRLGRPHRPRRSLWSPWTNARNNRSSDLSYCQRPSWKVGDIW